MNRTNPIRLPHIRRLRTGLPLATLSACVALVLTGILHPVAAVPVTGEDCPKNLRKARETVQRHWSFYVMKENAFDLDGAVERLMPDAQSATTADACVDVLHRFMASLGDGHAALVAYPGATPKSSPDGIALRSFRESALSDGRTKPRERVYVIRATEGLVDPGLLGAEVIAINGASAREALDHARERTPSSTTWGRAHWADERLLLGPAGSTVTISIRQGGESRDVELQRPARPTSDKEWKAFWQAHDDTASLVSWLVDDEQLGRIAFSSFAYERGQHEFEAALEEVRGTRGLVIDLRGNGGGSTAILEKLLGRFDEKGFDVGRFIVRSPGSQGVVSDFEPWKVKKRGWTYDKPVVILVDAGCFSACEIFASAMMDARRARIVGTPTGGGSASPLTDNLSSGWDGVTISMSIFVVTRPDGSHIESKGVTPHLKADAKIADYVNGRDPVMEKGLAELRKLVENGAG